MANLTPADLSAIQDEVNDAFSTLVEQIRTLALRMARDHPSMCGPHALRSFAQSLTNVHISVKIGGG